MKKDAMEKQYRQITALYDMAEELAATVDSDFHQDPDAQFVLVEPLINQIADSADILTEEYISVQEKPARRKAARSKIEAALRKIFTALDEYKDRLGIRGKKALIGLHNIADPIADKIRKQAEKIIVIFLQLVDLSLERVMHKHDIEQFNRTHGKAVSQYLQPGH